VLSANCGHTNRYLDVKGNLNAAELKSMFDRIFIKKNKISESSVDLGKLCEALLFYDQTDFL
jgi:hypothetical protein